MGERTPARGRDWASELRRLALGARVRAGTMRPLHRLGWDRRHATEVRNLADLIERFSLATTAVQALVYDYDLQTNRIVRSTGLIGLLGFDPSEVPDSVERWRKRIHPDDLPRLHASAERHAETNWTRTAEYRVRHRDGHWVHVWDRSVLIHDADGEPRRMVGSTIDITERTLAQERANRLLEIATAFSRAVSTDEIVSAVLAVAVPAVGADGGSVTLASDDGRLTTAGATGHPAELIDRWRNLPLDEQFPLAEAARSGDPIWIESRDAWASRFPSTLAEFEASGFGAVASLPLFFERRFLGGIAFDFREDHRFSPEERSFMQAVAGQCALALERARLFESERRARDGTVAAEARYRALFDGSVDAILVFDPRGKAIEANRAALRLLKVPPGGHRLPSFDELFAAPQVDTERAWYDIQRAGTWMLEHDLNRPNGEAVPVETRADRIGSGAGSMVIVSMRDISVRRAAERTQQAFLASISHDLKSPLAGFDVQAQMLRRRARRGERIQADEILRRTDSMLVSVRRMGDLIDELVDIAQIRLGHPLDLRLTRVDLGALIVESVEQVAGLADSARIVFTPPEEPISGVWDASRLSRVIDNLLTNAIKYSRSGGQIRVAAEHRDEKGVPSVAFVVEDEGIGIPEVDIPHIFDSFRRGTNVANRPIGHGVGLSGARQIVRQHGGDITVHSREGNGSRFEVVLPLRVELRGNVSAAVQLASHTTIPMAQGVHELASDDASAG